MATFWMCHKITIAGSEVHGITKVDVQKADESLSGVAFLEFPAYNQNTPFDAGKKWKRGDEVVINLGYNNQYQEEFKGFVRSISVNNPCVIACEDGMYKFRKKIESKEFKKASVDVILNYVCNQIGGMKLEAGEGLSGLKYDKFIIRPNVTGYDVLKKIQEQWKIKINAIGLDTLVANLAYVERTGKVTYDFAENVKSANLDFVVEEDVKAQVIVRGIGKDNKVTKDIEVGEKGGEVVKLPDQMNVTDEGVLKKMAEQKLTQLRYTGYRGDLTGWGLPFCDVGYTATVKDPDFIGRDGGYYVKAINVRFSKETGYERKVSLGAKLN